MRLWLQAGVILVAVAAAIAPVSSDAVERVFSTRVYPLIQRGLTPVSNAVPFALFDPITLGAAVLLIVVLWRGIRRAWIARSVHPLLPILGRVAVAAAVAYLAFLALWGFNYRRIPMTQRLVLDRGAPTTDAVVALGLDAVARLNALHAEAHRIGWLAPPWDDPALRSSFDQVQRQLSDAPPAVPGRLKRTLYGQYFRWTSVDGMVNPFALEVLGNPDLLPFERPVVAAHEWAHLAGYANEAEASFVGWLTCVRANVPAQYSGWLNLYWEIGSELSAEHRTRLWDALSEGPRGDVQAVIERIRRGQLPRLRAASWRVYDSYLRANRVEEGIRSYGEVITLVLRARFEAGWTPVRAPSR